MQLEDQGQLVYDDVLEEEVEINMRTESFEEYINRVGHLIPKAPHNVLEHWIYRHYDFILNQCIQLGIENMRFVKESWNIDKIYNDIKLFDGEELGGLGYYIYEREEDTEVWLVKLKYDGIAESQ